MAEVDKIDSNQTELRIAEEESVGVLPVTPTWKQYDPNEYGDFGGEIITVARNPINRGRQRKKGVVVDLKADGEFTVDLTPDCDDIFQGFLFASARRKDELSIAVVDGTGNDYEPASGGTGYQADDLLFAKQLGLSANNGLKKVTGAPTAASVPVTDTGLVSESGASGIISRVGFEFGSGLLSVDVSGTLPKIVAANVAALGTLTFAGNAADGETVTIGATVYTWETGALDAPFKVKVGASAAASIVNLVAAINLTGTPGTEYAAGTTIHPDVSAVDGAGDTIVATAKVKGQKGNLIATTETMTNGSWGGVTLASGAGRAFTTLGIIPGEWICSGDDGVNQSFTNVVNNGLKRVKSVTSDYIEIDKSSSAMVTDAGAGKTVRILFGRVIKNENGTEVAHPVQRRSYQLERSLGAPDDSQPTQIQGEYLTGSIPNEFELAINQADKIVATMSFMSRDHETRTAAQGLKSGNRPTPVDSDAFNATSHVRRLRLAVHDPANEAPTDLFAFVMDLTLKVNNNVKENKAVKFLGAFDNTAGQFDVTADMQAYFATVTAVATVRANEDATLDITLAQGGKGVTFDLPLITIGNARLEVEQDEAIMLPIETSAATAAKLDANYNHTLVSVWWDYIPALAI